MIKETLKRCSAFLGHTSRTLRTSSPVRLDTGLPQQSWWGGERVGKFRRATYDQRGFSFVELIITAAITALVFGGLFVSYETIIHIIAESRMKSNALALATERIEFIRSLAYDDVGTQGGVPTGALPQTAIRTLNGIPYHERLLITYIDDPADGLGSADTNGITADYKLVKVEYAWEGRRGTSTIFHTTNIVPRGIETTAGGGTIRVNVFDATAQPVAGVEVRFVNTAGTPIDTVRFTGVSGEAYLSGAPAGSGYEIYVTRGGYSSDSTHQASVDNPNPLTPLVSVMETQVSTMNFQIDRLSTLSIGAYAPAVTNSFVDEFTDASQLSANTNTDVTGGALTLLETAGVYPASGAARSVFFTPATIAAWGSAQGSFSAPASTNVRLQVYYDPLSPTLVPESDLPGNSLGFTGTTIDLSALSPATYPALALGVVLETADASNTPSLRDWRLTAIESRAPLAGVPIQFTSQRLIGEGVPKFRETITTGASGTRLLTGLEWGSYILEEQSAAYVPAEICPHIPYGLQPNDNASIDFTLVPTPPNGLRVTVQAGDGTPISGARVALSRGTFTDELESSLCGQVFFVGPGEAEDFTLTVEKPGYSTTVRHDVVVDAPTSVAEVILTP